MMAKEATEDIQARLRRHAENLCVPYLLGHPTLAAHVDRISLVLVGSAASGLCHAESDVDIALVCDSDVREAIARGTRWDEGRPSEEVIDDTQLHYYGVTFDCIKEGFRGLDDVTISIYGGGYVLRDPGSRYRSFLERLPEGRELRRRRVEAKLDSLMRRSRGLSGALSYGDPVTVGRICLKLISTGLMLVALLHDVPFDPRKRLFGTALRGPLGRRVEAHIRGMLGALGALGELDLLPERRCSEYCRMLDDLTRWLMDEAVRQGLRCVHQAPD